MHNLFVYNYRETDTVVMEIDKRISKIDKIDKNQMSESDVTISKNNNIILCKIALELSATLRKDITTSTMSYPILEPSTNFSQLNIFTVEKNFNEEAFISWFQRHRYISYCFTVIAFIIVLGLQKVHEE